jgi:surface carbohydrate biosynthesis protein
LVKRLPIVYLPVEFQFREFDGKALIAAVLAKRGYNVLFGQQWTLGANFDHWPPGAVLFKSFNNIHRPAMLAAKRNHQRLFVLEEELLAHSEKQAIANYCTDGIFDLPDVVLANGACEKAALVALSGGKARVEVTGNPRVDLLKPDFRAFFSRDIAAIRARFGDFVLVNTNFGIINTAWPDIAAVTQLHIDAGFVKPDDPASVQAWEDQIEFERLNKAAMIDAIKDLSGRRPNLNIVVRPHPAEALERWAGIFDDLPNVSVVREGPHVSWTLACKLLLHTSCTTGFEAHAAGKLALSLVTNPNWISRSFISNQLNPVFTDSVALVDAAEGFLERGEAVASGHMGPAEAAQYVWNIGNKNAAHRIATLLTQDLPASGERVALPAVDAFDRNPAQKEKLAVSLPDCIDTMDRIFKIIGAPKGMRLDQIDESLFYFSPAAGA